MVAWMDGLSAGSLPAVWWHMECGTWNVAYEIWDTAWCDIVWFEDPPSLVPTNLLVYNPITAKVLVRYNLYST